MSTVIWCFETGRKRRPDLLRYGTGAFRPRPGRRCDRDAGSLARASPRPYNPMGCGEGYMVARINTVAFQGISVLDIDVQVQMASGLPAFTIVGSN